MHVCHRTEVGPMGTREAAAAKRKYTDPAVVTALSHVGDDHPLPFRIDTSTGRLHARLSSTIRSPPLAVVLRLLLPSTATSPNGALCYCIKALLVDAPSRSMDDVERSISLRGLIEVE